MDLFDHIYLLTDARSVCDTELTSREVLFLEETLNLDKSASILDLCGGQGRHSLELSRSGFSDVTVLHAFFQKKLNMESIHGLMPYSIRDTHEIDPSSVESLKKALFGSKLDYAFPAHKLNQTGTTRGQLMGGNLSVLYSLTGTNFLSPTKGTILFLEDVDEYLYHIDRMMYNLKLGGFLDHLNGMIIGHMTGMNDNDIPFGKDAYQIIHDIVSEYDFPVCYGFPAGHENPNLALILGRQVELTVEEESCRIVFSD